MSPAPSPLRLLPWGLSAVLLLLPALAMLVTEEVAWGPEDFAAMAVLLALACGAYEVARRATRRRALAALAIVAAALYVWAELAVGVFTSLGS